MHQPKACRLFGIKNEKICSNNISILTCTCVRMFQSKRMRWTVHVASIEQIGNKVKEVYAI